MPNDADVGRGSSFPGPGTAPALTRNPVSERLRTAKRTAIEAAMGKGESWATKVINGESGVLLDDLPALLNVLGLKVVDASTVAVDPILAKAYEAIARKAITQHSLLIEGDDV